MEPALEGVVVEEREMGLKIAAVIWMPHCRPPANR